MVVIGSSGPKDDALQHIPIHYTGHINDERTLATFYAAADLSVAPSLEDNLPNTVMEALACGTPCVAFDIGGIPDMIEHQVNGYLARPFEVDDLAHGMVWCLQDHDRRFQLAYQARAKVEREFSLSHQVGRYLALFREILEMKA